MYRFLLIVIASCFLTMVAWAQEEPTEPDEPDETEEPQVAAEEIDEAGLDEQGFTDEDDDFRPSEDIPADQSIAFPTDI